MPCDVGSATCCPMQYRAHSTICGHKCVMLQTSCSTCMHGKSIDIVDMATVDCFRCKPTQICRLPYSMLNSMRLRPTDCRKICSGCKLSFKKHRYVTPGLVACIPALCLFCCAGWMLSWWLSCNDTSADACGSCIFIPAMCHV